MADIVRKNFPKPNHNRALHSLSSSIEILFARFAWTIFPLLDAFLTCRERRRLLLADENATLFDKMVSSRGRDVFSFPGNDRKAPKSASLTTA